ncbi:MAG: outer membrane protein assembly factor BamA [Calditrichaeota bacterium]|nr:MAG: outer membrane protein assembly factor BamA [Calditrichota bacterium]
MTKYRARIALTLLLLLFAFVTVAQAQQEYRVVEVAVEGNKVASKSLILGVSNIDLGSPLSPSSTSTTIRRLFGLGIFSDVRIEAEEVHGGLKVYIIVKELPKLSGLEFKGNDKISTDDFKDKLSLGVGGYISPYLMEQKRNEIKDMYAKKGYFQAQVQADLEYSEDSSRAILKYSIDEKSKVKVEKVFLEGNERVPDNDIIKKMRNRKRGFLKSSDFAQDKFDEDKEKIIEEFHKKGYIDAYLISDSMTIDTTTNRMRIYLKVYEGPQYYFGDVTFTNNKELPEEYLRKKLKYSEGDIFNAENYDKTIEEFYSAYYDIGHLHIRLLDNRTTKNDSIIDINYDITEGLPSHINLVKIVGNRKTKDHVIRREISVLPGSKFNRELLIRSVRDVMALNYFGNVNPVPLDLPNGDVDVEFQVEEKQTGQVSAGAGYNSQDKVVGNLGLGIPNFRGMGQSINFNTEFGSRRSSFSLSFTEPWLYGRPTLFGADIYSIKRDWYDDYTEFRQGASIRFGKRLRWPDNYFRAFASYRIERDKYEDFSESFRIAQSYKDYYQHPTLKADSTYNYTYFTRYDSLIGTYTDSVVTQTYDPLVHDPYPGSILNYEDNWNTASRISFTITRDSRNLPEFATRGSQFSYTFEKTGGFLGGYWNYTKHKVSYAHFIPLFWKFAIAAKTQFGAIFTPGDVGDERILLSDRFTPGGVAYDGIIRGYDDGSITPDTLLRQDSVIYYIVDTADYRTIDPFNPNDSTTYTRDTVVYSAAGLHTRVRGNFMLISNVELQFPVISQQVYWLFFFDAGNSWQKFENIKPFTQLYTAGGFGIRIAVPGIGTIGFDFAKPFNNIRSQDNGWRTHFQIGTTFK